MIIDLFFLMGKNISDKKCSSSYIFILLIGCIHILWLLGGGVPSPVITVHGLGNGTNTNSFRNFGEIRIGVGGRIHKGCGIGFYMDN